MTLDKSKKRGRPAQLLQIAELHAFVDYLSQKKDRSDLQNDVIAMLRAEKFNFDSLSEALARSKVSAACQNSTGSLTQEGMHRPGSTCSRISALFLRIPSYCRSREMYR